MLNDLFADNLLDYIICVQRSAVAQTAVLHGTCVSGTGSQWMSIGSLENGHSTRVLDAAGPEDDPEPGLLFGRRVD